MKRILIVGATSAIAEATARRYATQGARLFLVARDADRLRSIADDLLVRGAESVATATLDVNTIAQHGPTLDAAWASLGTVDVVLIAHGTLPDQPTCEASTEMALREFQTNGTSTIALSLAVADRLREEATLAVISSVAGDRGRASNYLYGSAKAAVSTFLSGLRQRLHSSGINVLTIKPGFVDTPMTAAFRKGILWAKPETVAKGIIEAVDRRKSIVYLPGFWRPIMWIICHIPEAIFCRIRL